LGTLTPLRESLPISFAFTCVSAMTWPSAPLRSRSRALLSRCPGDRKLDPRPRPSPRLALFTRSADKRFSGSGCRPTISATDFRRADTLDRASGFRAFASPRIRSDAETALAIARFLGHATFPSRRRTTSAANRDSPSEIDPPGVASTPQGETSKAILRPKRRLRATLRPDHRLRRWPLDDSAGLRGPSRSERRTLPHTACCRRNDEGEGSPPHMSFSSTPVCHRSVARGAGCTRRSHEPTKAFVPASPREGQRVPESRDAFHPQEP